MNLVLIGYRGTGKSAVGALLAQRLGMPCVSMDTRIVETAGKPIAAIVEERGWPGFRDLETAIARELAAHDGLIIDAGGGVIERPENIDALRAHGRVVWLRASVATIIARIATETHRPSLTGGKSFTDEVAEILERRTSLYAAAADLAVDTDGVTPDEIAERIVAFWRRG